MPQTGEGVKYIIPFAVVVSNGGAVLGSFPDMRFFRLTKSGVRCDENGLFVGPTAMLQRSLGSGNGWTVRPTDELDRELSQTYGLPIDSGVKRDGVAGVARALERGDVALAQISALLLRLPDPPSLARAAGSSQELAEQLFTSGLLKDWDPNKHPRTQKPPNRAWFATKPVEPGAGSLAPRQSGGDGAASDSLWRKARDLVRPLIRNAAKAVAEKWSFAAWSNPILDAIEAALIVLEPEPTNVGEERVLAQLRASLDPPKTLDELQTPPTQNALGYEKHHIVEQNPANIAKSPISVDVDKFGRAVIDDPSNLVWIPRLKHELITAYYNAQDDGDPAGRLHRLVVNDLDYDSQYAAGLQALQKFGVLQ